MLGGPSFHRRPWPFGERRSRDPSTSATLPDAKILLYVEIPNGLLPNVWPKGLLCEWQPCLTFQWICKCWDFCLFSDILVAELRDSNSDAMENSNRKFSFPFFSLFAKGCWFLVSCQSWGSPLPVLSFWSYFSWESVCIALSPPASVPVFPVASQKSSQVFPVSSQWSSQVENLISWEWLKRQSWSCLNPSVRKNSIVVLFWSNLLKSLFADHPVSELVHWGGEGMLRWRMDKKWTNPSNMRMETVSNMGMETQLKRWKVERGILVIRWATTRSRTSARLDKTLICDRL